MAILAMWQISQFFLLRKIEDERETWHKERQMLLDRIQAPSFAEYTSKVIREKKAEHPEEKQDTPEFVS